MWMSMPLHHVETNQFEATVPAFESEMVCTSGHFRDLLLSGSIRVRMYPDQEHDGILCFPLKEGRFTPEKPFALASEYSKIKVYLTAEGMHAWGVKGCPSPVTLYLQLKAA